MDEEIRTTWGIYIVPKNEDGTLNPKYMVIWIDQDAIELSKTAVDFHKHLGLVRNTKMKGDSLKTSRGIRFSHEDFPDAWNKIRPGDPCPDTIPVRWAYKLSPTPTAATVSDLKKWLLLLKWKAKPIKALGPKAWLVGANEKQEETFLSWNGQSILVTSVANGKKNFVSPVLAGHFPRQRNQTTNVFQTGNPFADPWAAYQPSQTSTQSAGMSHNALKSTSAPNRQVEAPIEKRFQSQDAKIDELAVQITKLQSLQDTNQKEAIRFQTDVQKEFKAVRDEAQQQFDCLNRNFESSLEKAMSKQDRSMQQSFQELKLIMMNQPNPAKKAKATPPETKDGEAVPSNT